MQIPHVAIYVNPNGTLAMSHVNDDSGNPLEVETPLDFFDGRGYEETIKYLGRVVLGLMAAMYPEEMHKHPELRVPYDAETDLEVIQHLISKSLASHTKTFIPAIDALVDEVATKDPMQRTTITIAAWPEMRAMMEKNY